jgi:hypothetical protein
MLSGGAASVNNWITMKLGSTSTGYYNVNFYATANSATPAGVGSTNVESWRYAGVGSANSLNGFITLQAPNLATKTVFYSQLARTASASGQSAFFTGGGFLDNDTQYTAFTLTTTDGGFGDGTLTGGTIKVYGYQNS